jgi:hypothetical protein
MSNGAPHAREREDMRLHIERHGEGLDRGISKPTPSYSFHCFQQFGRLRRSERSLR